jgi:hypothetical protein
MLIYNNATGPVTRGTARSYLVGANITSAFITLEAGEKIVSAHVADPSITMTFPDSYYNIPNLLTPGLVSVTSLTPLSYRRNCTSTMLTPSHSIRAFVGHCRPTPPTARRSKATSSLVSTRESPLTSNCEH